MTDRDRLIELLTDSMDKQYEKCRLITPQLTADHLLANGVIIPPCKVGDMVYVIYNNEVIKGKVDSFDIVIEESNTSYVAGVKFFRQIAIVKGFSFGLNVFLTKEEAEAKLRERKEDEGK